MTKSNRWWIQNFVLISVFYLGFVQEITAFQIITLILFWFIGVAGTLLIFIAPYSVKGYKQRGTDLRLIFSVPRWLDVSLDLILAAALYYHGAVYTSVIYCTHIFGLSRLSREINKELNNETHEI